MLEDKKEWCDVLFSRQEQEHCTHELIEALLISIRSTQDQVCQDFSIGARAALKNTLVSEESFVADS